MIGNHGRTLWAWKSWGIKFDRMRRRHTVGRHTDPLGGGRGGFEHSRRIWYGSLPFFSVRPRRFRLAGGYECEEKDMEQYNPKSAAERAEEEEEAQFLKGGNPPSSTQHQN